MTYRYAYQGYNEEKMARAVGVSLPISYKQAREMVMKNPVKLDVTHCERL